MAYTDIDKPSDYFETVTYAGGTTDISSLDFQPDFVWGKKRDGAENHALFDSVRGATKTINSNTTALESTRSGSLTSFDSDGFTLGGSDGIISNSGSTYVAWSWKAGTAFSNSAGANGADIASSGSVNTTAGFSIVKWVGNATDDQQILHGLSSTVKMIICKRYIGGSADSWIVYHVGLPVTQYLILNSTSAGLSDNEVIWSDEHPTSSVFTVGNHGTTNDDGSTMIGYCFADVKGYSKFSSYIGNGNVSGSYIHLGFKPAFVLVKRTDATANWSLIDNTRDPFNVTYHFLEPNVNDDEFTPSGPQAAFDFCSQGFKCRSTNGAINASGGTYIYMAFAENPFVTSTGVPATAR
jgi:hypothetical protein